MFTLPICHFGKTSKLFKQVGNPYTHSFAGTNTALTAFNSSLIVFAASSALRVYEFDGFGFSSLGNTQAVTTNLPAIVAMSSFRVAYVENSGDDLSSYDFNGNDWVFAGATDFTPVGYTSLAKLTTSRVAMDSSDSNKDLKAYDFNGNSWSAVGNTRGADQPQTKITGLTDSTIAAARTKLETLSFNGSSWSQIGNDGNLASSSPSDLVALSSTRVVACHDNLDGLAVYDFDGTNWTQLGELFELGFNVSGGRLTALSNNRIVFTDATNQQFVTYDLQE